MKNEKARASLKEIEVTGVEKLENLHKIVGGIEPIGTGNCCTVCGLGGLDPIVIKF